MASVICRNKLPKSTWNTKVEMPSRTAAAVDRATRMSTINEPHSVACRIAKKCLKKNTMGPSAHSRWKKPIMFFVLPAASYSDNSSTSSAFSSGSLSSLISLISSSSYGSNLGTWFLLTGFDILDY